jgi:outer membrane murein-binding lipoprotein Lpp
MKDFLRKNLLLIIASVLIVLLTGLSGYLFYSNNQKINNLNNEKETLSQQYSKAKQDLDTANESIKLKDTQLGEKDKEIESLKQVANNAVRNDVTNDAKQTSSEIPSQESSSIYDKINGSDDFKNKISSALSLLSEKDSEHFQMTSNQVESINEYNDFGGKQEKRNIYIGADANAAITASLISHEAQHVYNVYVDRIWSYHTKEQELPCYQAELVTAQRVGAPAFFISSVQSSIDYWQSQ